MTHKQFKCRRGQTRQEGQARQECQPRRERQTCQGRANGRTRQDRPGRRQAYIRPVLIAVIAMLFAVAGGGCTGGAPPDENQPENGPEAGVFSDGTPLTASDKAWTYSRDKVQLVWVGYNLLPGGKKDAILARWHEKYPNIEVTYKDFPAEPASYTQALNGAFSSNETMDVLLLSHEEVLPRAQNGQLHELDSMARKAGDDIDRIFSGKLKSMQFGGSNYQLPYTISVDMLYYNKDLFDAKGVPYPDEQTTFAELAAMAKQLKEEPAAAGASGTDAVAKHADTETAAKPGTGADALPEKREGADGKIWGYIGKNPLQPAINAGWSWTDAEHKPAFADERVRKALEMHKDLIDSGATPSNLQIRVDKLKASVLFAEGKVAMMVENWWPPMFWSILKYNNGVLDDNAPAFRYDVTFLPRFDAAATPKQQEVSPGWGYAVNARTKHPFEAYLFAKFLTTEIPDINGYLPADKEADLSLYNQIFNTFTDDKGTKHTGLYASSFLRKLKQVMEETVPVVDQFPSDKAAGQLLTGMQERFSREADRYFAGMIPLDELISQVQGTGAN